MDGGRRGEVRGVEAVRRGGGGDWVEVDGGVFSNSKVMHD